MNRSCGDLIFSSHVTFTLAFALCFCRYGPRGPGSRGRVLRLGALGCVGCFSVLVVASRKHYTVDVVAAWCAAADRSVVSPPALVQPARRMLLSSALTPFFDARAT